MQGNLVTLNIFGRLSRFICRLAAIKAVSSNSNTSVFHKLYELAKKASYRVEPNLHEDFRKLLKSKENSFIFYGDHSYRLEPFLVILGYPEELKEEILKADERQVHSPTRVLTSETTSALVPYLSRYIQPISNINSNTAKYLCTKRFLDYEKNFHSERNNNHLKNASEFVAFPGHNLIMFPQGGVHLSKARWRTGLARIAMQILNTSDSVKNVYLVPFGFKDLRKTEFWRMLLRAFAINVGLKKGKNIQMFYGKPISIKDYFNDLPKEDSSVETSYKYANEKVAYLQKKYEEWVKGF